jgi:hypothetical protein
MSTSELIARWAVAFTLTQIVECLVYRRGFGVSLGVAFAASAITHPIVVFVIWPLWGLVYVAIARASPGFALGDTAYFAIYGVVAETLAFAIEAVWLSRVARLGLRRGAIASLVANASSGLLGLMLSVTTGWP